MNQNLRRLPGTLLLPALLALVFANPAAHAQDATLDRAQQLIATQKGEGRAAFELLAPLEEQRAGDPAYDYLLGLAAIDAGEFTRAVFALERVLATQPSHPQARAEIARAYFLMGENRTAREEFQAVKAANPPVEVAATVDRFLSALDARQSGQRSGFTGFLEAGFGHDSNINAATGAGTFAIPAFGGLVFNQTAGAGRSSGWFSTIAAGVSGRRVIDAQWSLFANLSANRRYNQHLDRFDTGTYGADGGVVHRRDDHDFTVALQTQVFDLDERRFRNAIGGLAQWRYNVSSTQQFSAYAQWTRLTYPAGYTINNPTTTPTYASTSNDQGNANRKVLGVAWASSLQGPLAPVVYAGLYGGTEILMTRLGEAPGDPVGYNHHRGHRVTGARVGGEIRLSPEWSGFANASYEDRRYAGLDPLFLVHRHDEEANLRVGASFTPNRNWTLTPQISMTENRSPVVINAYRRSMISATLRYDFR